MLQLVVLLALDDELVVVVEVCELLELDEVEVLDALVLELEDVVVG